jgi:hypothetical protein
MDATKGEFRPVRNDFRIFFMTITTIIEYKENIASIQQYYFDFADYEGIASRSYNFTYLTGTKSFLRKNYNASIIVASYFNVAKYTNYINAHKQMLLEG